jgi:hypothetical protein
MKLFNQWTPDLTGAWLSPVAGSAARRLGGSQVPTLTGSPDQRSNQSIQCFCTAYTNGPGSWQVTVIVRMASRPEITVGPKP